MKKVLSVRAVTVALLSLLVAFCVVWGGISLFSPAFGRAEGTENETTAPTVAEIVEGYKDKLVADNIVDGEITPIILSGTREQIAAGWSAAFNKATTKYVYVRLDSDWVAERPLDTDGIEQDTAPIFGAGAGFVTSASVGVGAIDVTGRKIILDLNGHVIDRDLNNEKYAGKKYNGSVIYVSSASSDLVLVDSAPTAEHKLDGDGAQTDRFTYEQRTISTQKVSTRIVENTEIKTVTGGVITGGKAAAESQWGIAFGGGIRMYLGNLHMYGGTVFGNKVSFNGAGIYCNGGGNIVIDGGNVIANKGLSSVSGSLGGGVFVSAKVEFTFKSGSIFANVARSGAGIQGDNDSKINITGGSISGNLTENNGQGGGIYANGILTVSGGVISHNKAGHSGGGIYSSNIATAEIAGGEISYNLSNVGGGITANADLTLSGGTITKNYESSYFTHGAGVYFLTGGCTLKLAGPVVVKENGVENSVSNEISGAKTVTVTGELERGEAPDENCAEIYISEYLAPITGYGENGLNREDGHVIDPSRYFHFTYNPDDIGKAVFQEGVGVIYETPFKTIYYGSNTGNSGDYNIDLQITDSQYGMVMNYGEYGKFGLCVSLESGTGDDSAEENVWFHRYAYDKKNESADEDDLGEYQSYGRAVIEAGIYVGSAQVKTGDGWRYITIRVVVRPKSLESATTEFGAAGYVKIAYDNADKVFNGNAHTPTVSSVAIEEGENSTWFESLVKDSAYTVEYENNIHVAGASYVVVKGIGNYGGTVKLPFDIVQPSGHNYTENGDTACVTEWQAYNGTAWAAISGSSAFTYDDTSKKYSVRALVKSKFDDGTVYNSYVYAADGKEADFKLAVGDTILIDPGLKLVFKKGDTVAKDIFDAGTYAISIECADAANGMIGDFALPDTAIGSEVVMAPYSITKAELDAATAESGTSLLAVALGDGEWLPFITEVKYVADGVAVDGNTLFGYVLYNGKEFSVALNPEFKINIEMLGRGFVNYVTDVTYKHTVSGATVTTLKGELNKIITVTTEISFKLNSNFVVTDGGASGNTGVVTKTWNIVTKHNSLEFGETASTFAYGENGALALPEQGVDGNAMTVVFAKATSETQFADVASVFVESGKLYECVDGGKGDAISGTLREYFDGVLFDNGIGKYRVTATALDHVSDVDGENGAIYFAVPAEVEFTVTTRSISDSVVTTTVATDGLVYSGEAVEAKVTLVFNGVTLEKDTDYTLTYDNNVHAGDGASVAIKGIGNYAGDIEKTYSIAKATDNEWTVSLNIASWVNGKFNRNISVITGRTKYGAGTLSFEIEPPEDIADKLTQDIIDGLKSIEAQNGKVTAATEEVLRKLPVGAYKLIARMQESTDYNAIGGEYVFNVLEEQYVEPSLNVIAGGATQNQIYTGNLLSMSIRNFDGAAMSVECSSGLYFDANGGTVYATNAGTYTVKLHLISDECTWMDGTTDDITLTWTIAPRVVKAPVPDENKFIVNGSIQSYMPQGFDPTLMTIENNERSEAGRTYVTVYLKDDQNYVWDDGTNGARVFAWEIETADWIFVTIACVLGGVVFITVLFAVGQYFKHRARMADLAEAEKMRGASDDDKGGNA